MVYSAVMTQPAPPPAPPAPHDLEERLRFQQHVVQVAEAVLHVVRNVEPRLTVMALINVAVTASQSIPVSRDELIQIIATTYDRFHATMALLGVKPGEPMPADAKERIEKLMSDALRAQGA